MAKNPLPKLQVAEPMPLLLLGFRDELTSRPWQPPARHWPGSALVGGRDEQAGGTWLAVHPGPPRVSCILNARGQEAPPSSRRSRGELPLRAADEGFEALRELHKDPAALDNLRRAALFRPSAQTGMAVGMAMRLAMADMAKDPKAINRGSNLILVALYLERIADHATNICERVVYMVEGVPKPIKRSVVEINQAIAHTESLGARTVGDSAAS